jgi:short-subunit dehydrogenase
MQLDGKAVLITGASEGIGAACAAEFLRYGARVALTARSEEGLRRTAGTPGAVVVPGDLTQESVRQEAVRRTIESFGAIDILVNNAGVGSFLPSWSAPLEEARRLMELNYFALLDMIRLAVPHMRGRGGLIVNVGSIGGKVPLPWSTLYSATKFAVGALTEGLRVELRSAGVRTMLVCPGYVSTNFQSNAQAGEAPEGVMRARRFVITPGQCAVAMRRGIEREARTVVVPRVGWVLVALARLFPARTEAVMARLIGTE